MTARFTGIAEGRRTYHNFSIGVQASDIFAFYAREFPDAEIVASSFEEYFEHLEEVASRLDLPVLTEEIGDSWVYGEPKFGASPTHEHTTSQNCHVSAASMLDGLPRRKHPC